STPSSTTPPTAWPARPPSSSARARPPPPASPRPSSSDPSRAPTHPSATSATPCAAPASPSTSVPPAPSRPPAPTPPPSPPPPAPEGLRDLAALGFGDFARLSEEGERGVFWITRLPAQTSAKPPGAEAVTLSGRLKSARLAGEAEIGLWCEGGGKEVLPGRLV